MNCAVCATLLTDFEDRVSSYRQAVVRLRLDGELLVHAEYMLLWTLAKRALDGCTESQRNLEEHRVEHRCCD
jgi:hypothetical protein